MASASKNKAKKSRQKAKKQAAKSVTPDGVDERIESVPESQSTAENGTAETEIPTINEPQESRPVTSNVEPSIEEVSESKPKSSDQQVDEASKRNDADGADSSQEKAEIVEESSDSVIAHVIEAEAPHPTPAADVTKPTAALVPSTQEEQTEELGKESEIPVASPEPVLESPEETTVDSEPQLEEPSPVGANTDHAEKLEEVVPAESVEKAKEPLPESSSANTDDFYASLAQDNNDHGEAPIKTTLQEAKSPETASTGIDDPEVLGEVGPTAGLPEEEEEDDFYKSLAQEDKAVSPQNGTEELANESEALPSHVSELSPSNAGEGDFFEQLAEGTLKSEEIEATPAEPTTADEDDPFYKELNKADEESPADDFFQNLGQTTQAELEIELELDEDFLDDGEVVTESVTAVVMETTPAPVESLDFLEIDEDLLSEDGELDVEDYAEEMEVNPQNQPVIAPQTLKPKSSIAAFHTEKTGFDLPTELIPKRSARHTSAHIIAPPISVPGGIHAQQQPNAFGQPSHPAAMPSPRILEPAPSVVPLPPASRPVRAGAPAPSKYAPPNAATVQTTQPERVTGPPMPTAAVVSAAESLKSPPPVSAPPSASRPAVSVEKVRTHNTDPFGFPGMNEIKRPPPPRKPQAPGPQVPDKALPPLPGQGPPASASAAAHVVVPPASGPGLQRPSAPGPTRAVSRSKGVASGAYAPQQSAYAPSAGQVEPHGLYQQAPGQFYPPQPGMIPQMHPGPANNHSGPHAHPPAHNFVPQIAQQPLPQALPQPQAHTARARPPTTSRLSEGAPRALSYGSGVKRAASKPSGAKQEAPTKVKPESQPHGYNTHPQSPESYSQVSSAMVSPRSVPNAIPNENPIDSASLGDDSKQRPEDLFGTELEEPEDHTSPGVDDLESGAFEEDEIAEAAADENIEDGPEYTTEPDQSDAGAEYTSEVPSETSPEQDISMESGEDTASASVYSPSPSPVSEALENTFAISHTPRSQRAPAPAPPRSTTPTSVRPSRPPRRASAVRSAPRASSIGRAGSKGSLYEPTAGSNGVKAAGQASHHLAPATSRDGARTPSVGALVPDSATPSVAASPAKPTAATVGGAAIGASVSAEAIAKLSAKFPAPLVNAKGPIKSRRKDLEKWLDERISVIDPLDKSQPGRVLFPLMRELLRPEAERKLANVLLGDLPHDFKTSHKNSIVPETAVNRELISDLEKDFASGNRTEALQHALDARSWVHALIVAHSMGSEEWTSAVLELVREEIRASSKPLAFLYRVLAGMSESDGADAVNELKPAGTTSLVDNEGIDRNLESWAAFARLLVTNAPSIGPGTPARGALLSLGKLLLERGKIEEGHACMIISGAPLFGDKENGFIAPLAETDQPNSLESLELAQTYEYILGTAPLAHLIPLKLMHAEILADAMNVPGLSSQIADNSLALARVALKKSAPQTIVAAELLANRLAAAAAQNSETQDGWLTRKLSRPNLEKAWVSSFNKFVSGEDEPPAGGNGHADPSLPRPASTEPPNTQSGLYGQPQPRASTTPGPYAEYGGAAPDGGPQAYPGLGATPSGAPLYPDFGAYSPSSAGYFPPGPGGYQPPAGYGGYAPASDSMHDLPGPSRTPVSVLPEEDEEGYDEEGDDLGIGNGSHLNSRAPKPSAGRYEPVKQPQTSPSAEAEEDADENSETEPKSDKKDNADDGSKKGRWFSSWWHKNEGEPKAIKAKLGEENAFYYDEDLKRWVNKNGPPPEAKKLPPPPPSSLKRSSTPGAPRPASSSPAVGPPSKPATPLMPPTSGPTPSARSTPSLQPKPKDGGIDSLLDSAATQSAGGRRAKRGARNRYVDVFAQQKQ